MYDSLRYCIFDPTGNITALVESPVDVLRQPAAAAGIMRRHPEVEQVGFLTLAENAQPSLRMAGGEFCGNASMCAAALTVHRTGGRFLRPVRTEEPSPRPDRTISLSVSGSHRPVEVRLREEGDQCWSAAVKMPPAQGIENRAFGFGGLRGMLPLVRMEGISHLVIEPDSPFFSLLADRAAAEEAVRQWCGRLQADGLGLMFSDNGRRLTPLVYIPVSDTLFWENSCASGSAAVSMAMAERSGGPVSLSLTEPGGTLRAESSPEGETTLYGHVKLIEEYFE